MKGSILKNSTLGLVYRGTQTLIFLITTPASIEYVGIVKFGVLSTIVSTVSLLAFVDFGIGLYVQNNIRNQEEKGEAYVRETVSSSFFLLSAVSLVLLLFANINKNAIFHWLNISQDSVKDGLTVFLAIFLLNLPFSLVQKILIGLGKNHVNYKMQLITALLGLFFFYLTINYDWGFAILLVSLYAPIFAANLLNFLIYIINNKSWSPRLSDVKIKIINQVLKSGFTYFLVQIATLVLWNSNNVILATKNEYGEVATFNIAYRVVLLFLVPVEILSINFLPFLNNFLASNNFKAGGELSKKLFFLYNMYGVIGFVSIYYGANHILKYWIDNENVVLTQPEIFAIAFFMIYSVVNYFISYISVSDFFINKTYFFFMGGVFVSTILKIFYAESLELLYYLTAVPMLIIFIMPSAFIIHKHLISNEAY